MADIGFTQFIIPNNIVFKDETEVNSSLCKEDYPIENIKDSNLYTYCALDKEVDDPYIIIDFKDFYKINYIKCFFNVFFTKIRIYDYSGNVQGTMLGELDTSERGIDSFNFTVDNQSVSKIKLCNFETYFEEDDIEIIEIAVDLNEVIPPEGYHFKDIKIESQPAKLK